MFIQGIFLVRYIWVHHTYEAYMTQVNEVNIK